MLTSVQLGYYSGIIAGALVDKLPNLYTYLVAAVLSIISYSGLAYTIGSEFGLVLQLLTCLLLFLAGLSASIGTVASIVSAVKNFDDKVSALLVAIMITYMKMAQNFDEALHDAFFPESSAQTYLIIIGIISTLVLILGALTMRKIEFDKATTALMSNLDPLGTYIFIAVCGLYLFSYFVVVRLFEIYSAGVIIIIGFLIINFIMLGISVFIIFTKLKKGGGVSAGSIGGLLSKKKELSLSEYIKEPKYPLILVATMCVIGAGYSYKEQAVALGAEAEAFGALALAANLFWLTDALGRFVGGVLAYFLVEKVNGYMFLLAYSICSLIGNIGIFVIVGLDIDGGFFLLVPAFFQGLGVGGFWVAVA